MDNDELLIAMKDMFEKKIEEVKTHTGVLVERLETNVKAVAEGHEVLLRKIENVEKRIDNIDKNMDIVKDYVIGVDLKLNEHEIILKRVK